MTSWHAVVAKPAALVAAAVLAAVGAGVTTAATVGVGVAAAAQPPRMYASVSAAHAVYVTTPV